MVEHLYTHGGKRKQLRRFEERYGTKHGKEVYGAVVGKVRRQRMAKGLCSVRGCGTRARHYHGIHGCCGFPAHHSAIVGHHMVRDIGNNFQREVLH